MTHPRIASAIGFLLALVVSGCGGDDTGDGPVEIRYLRWGEESELDATRAALARFEQLNPSIDVRLEPTSWGQYFSKLQTLIAGGSPPDVFAVSGAWFHDLRERGALLDLADHIAGDPSISLDAFFDAAVDIYRTDDGLYGIPRDFNVVALFYNKTLFDEAGLAYPDSSWTWGTFRDAAARLTRDVDGDGRTDQWGYQVSNDMEVCWGNFVYQNGGSILSPDRGESRLSTPETIEAFEFLHRILYEDGSSPSPLELESLSGTPFRNGRLAMISSGSWTLAKLDEVEDFRYGVAPLPQGRRRAAIANGIAHSISAKSKHADAAWALVAFLSGEEGQRLLAESGTSIPAHREVAVSPAFLAAGRDDVDRRVFLDAMSTARTLPFTAGLARWAAEVLKALDRVWLGERSPREALEEVSPKVDAVLGGRSR